MPEIEVNDSADVRASKEIKISIKNLNFFYGKNQALDDVSLDIETKKVSSFIGPSGCGKSTFLRTLNRMNDTIPNTRVTGKITLDGTDIYKGFKDISSLRMRVGMVFQKSNPFPKSIFENVAFGLKVNGIKDKSIISNAVEDTLKRAYLW
ncbi:MAG: phosphate ABC transporter ATP-binding protein, partial [Candidatus Zixiibacteriota bacterium]